MAKREIAEEKHEEAERSSEAKNQLAEDESASGKLSGESSVSAEMASAKWRQCKNICK